MMKFDHLNLPVSDLDRSRAWWTATLGLKVEFEVPATRTVSLQDGEGFAIFLQEKPGAVSNGAALWFQVDDVDKTFADWTGRPSGATVPSSRTPTATSCGCGTSAQCGRNEPETVTAASFAVRIKRACVTVLFVTCRDASRFASQRSP
jgi:catechol 2,3-dioxygenase-like lactoylglutathione lyase family enzyme